jgi:hypothetical protein
MSKTWVLKVSEKFFGQNEVLSNRSLNQSAGERFGGNKIRVDKFCDESRPDEVDRIVDGPGANFMNLIRP